VILPTDSTQNVYYAIPAFLDRGRDGVPCVPCKDPPAGLPLHPSATFYPGVRGLRKLKKWKEERECFGKGPRISDALFSRYLQTDFRQKEHTTVSVTKYHVRRGFSDFLVRRKMTQSYSDRFPNWFYLV
jgi:hypothetical protein